MSLTINKLCNWIQNVIATLTSSHCLLEGPIPTRNYSYTSNYKKLELRTSLKFRTCQHYSQCHQEIVHDIQTHITKTIHQPPNGICHIYVCKQGEVKCLQTLPMYDVQPIRATQVVKCKRGSWEGKKTHRFIQARNQYYGHQLSSKRKKNLEKLG